jgi:hypothetical protein
MQENMPSDVFRFPDRMFSRLQRRAADGIEFERIEELGGQSGVKGRPTLAHRNVDAVALKICQVLGCHDPHVKIGVGVHELAQPRDQPLGCKRWRDADNQVRLLRPKIVGRLKDEVKGTLHGGEVRPSFFSQRQAAGQTLEQLDVQGRLQAAYLLGDGALGDTDLFGREPEVERAPGSFKCS